MKLKTILPLILLALAAFAFLCIPNVTASDLPAPTQVLAAGSMCSADLAGADLLTLPLFAQSAAGGCGPASCNSSCRARGYDFGVCLGSTCICRFYFP